MGREYFVEDIQEAIDHTLLRQDVTQYEVTGFINEAVSSGLKAVFVSPCWVCYAREILPEEMILGTTVGFPFGASTIDAKCYEAAEAVEIGADEIDYVINIGFLKSGDTTKVFEEMKAIVDTVKESGNYAGRKNIGVKCIIETCLLNEIEKLEVLELAVEAGLDYIKTSTGFASKGAEINDVKLLANSAGDRIKIKASGGIRFLDDVLSFMDAGASRIGTSDGVKIIKEAKAKLKNKL